MVCATSACHLQESTANGRARLLPSRRPLEKSRLGGSLALPAIEHAFEQLPCFVIAMMQMQRRSESRRSRRRASVRPFGDRKRRLGRAEQASQE